MIAGDDRRVHAFSLIEMVTALAITSLLLGALGSSLVLLNRAQPTEADAARERAASVQAELAEELAQMVHLVAIQAGSVAFIVPDRDGDGLPEHVEWTFDGGSEQLVRAEDGMSVVMLEGVAEHRFEPQWTSLQWTFSGPTRLSEPVHLAHFETSQSPSGQPLDNGRAVAAPLSLQFPAGVLGWRPAAASFMLESDPDRPPTGRDLKIAIRELESTDQPTGAIHASTLISESDVPTTFSWVDASWSDPPLLSPALDGAIVLEQPTATDRAVEARYASWADMSFYRRGSSGDAWQTQQPHALLFGLTARLLLEGHERLLTRDALTGVQVTTQMAGSAELSRYASVPSRPQALELERDLNMIAQPLKLDFDFDGAVDWLASDGSLTDLLLSGGIWSAQTAIELTDALPADEPVTIDVVARDETTGDGGLLLECVFDHLSLLGATTQLHLEKTDADTQVLHVTLDDGLLGPQTIWRLELEAGRWVHARLLADPAGETISLVVDDQAQGTVSYNTDVVVLESDLKLIPSGHGTKVEHVRVAVGGSITTQSNANPAASMAATPISGTSRVSFDASASSDPDNDSLSYFWDLGDGTSSTSASLTHEYPAAGTYAARLHVRDGNGGHDVVSTTVEVGP